MATSAVVKLVVELSLLKMIYRTKPFQKEKSVQFTSRFKFDLRICFHIYFYWSLNSNILMLLLLTCSILFIKSFWFVIKCFRLIYFFIIMLKSLINSKLMSHTTTGIIVSLLSLLV